MDLLLGALLGFASAGAIRWWQYRRDLWLSQIDRFCDTIDIAAQLAANYWLRPKQPDAEPLGPVHSALDLQEARMMGLQIRCDGMLLGFVDRLSATDQEVLNELMNNFTEAATGGDFNRAAREPDPERAQLAELYSSELILKARECAGRALTVVGTISHWSRGREG